MLAAAMTYSIVARDPATGELGAAVQSHWFSVGALCPWARAGVGAVATQSIVEPAHGPRARPPGGRRVRGGGVGRAAGRRPDGRAAPGRHRRRGRSVAAHTGERCVPCAGHVLGEHWACQANMMLRDTVPAAMSAAFEAADGDLAER